MVSNSLIEYIFSTNSLGTQFNSLTARGFGAFFTSLVICFILLRYIINYHTSRMNFQPIRECNIEHKLKQNTPTMGGLAIVIATLIASLLWVICNVYILIILNVMIIFAILGFTDDYLKIKYNDITGVRGKVKIIIQFLTSLCGCYLIMRYTSYKDFTSLSFPMLKEFSINLGIFYYIFAAIVVIGTSNAVNLTDGLDGLSAFPIAVSISFFAFVAYLIGGDGVILRGDLVRIEGAQEITILSAAIIGAMVSFLWFNCAPAQIFMGDVGSLSLGGVIGIMAVILKKEILLVIVGGVFVIEAISVIIQVYYFKLTNGKRFFKMAPIHHHFERLGLKEVKIVIRFWLISIILAVLGLMLFFGE